MPRKIGFDEGAAELTAENARKKEKLTHVVLHGQDATPDGVHIGDYPPKDPTKGQLWLRASDSTMLLWYIDSYNGKGIWVKTYEK